jgi:hypothetical protein
VAYRIRIPLLLAALAAAVFALPVAGAQATDLPVGGTFIDDDELLEEGWIEAIAEIRVTRGCNPPVNDKYCPERTVIRGEMASFLVRALDLPPAVEDHFVDDGESVHQDAINALYEAGITKGCNPPENTKFCPDAPTTRGEMAAFLNRAFAFPATDGTDYFIDDDSSVFEGDIDRIAAAGITAGCGSGKYCPRDPMKRSHMAVFLGRSLDLTPNTPEPRPHVIGTFTTYYPAGQSRVTNIHLIADAADGAVVMPGETWSLNEHVGQRTTAKGYVAAGAIINGELYCCDHPANIGGGTSQFATTLYNAVFFAGLDDVDHHPHSIYFSRYPLGREATLGWPGPDVKFRNDTLIPVTIDTSHTSTSVTVRIIGANGRREVTGYTYGSATTSAGGTVKVKRVIKYLDGTRNTETWTHRYNPLGG